MWGEQGKCHSHAYKVGLAMGRAALIAEVRTAGNVCDHGLSVIVRYGHVHQI